ncbi:LEA type 2 family protein [Luteimonas sp. JM171]|uniref:LEA type 2 family protein n=1 Tax=Luteimonas sp. JM171 TaxID=1896164 RepID=UPI000857E1D8|nr:LEA type 2 family protein [Luteimonas sp. JM171]AOH34965.1 hypothetical protein BGP89_00140 [Luteimonas sp. JM171]
MKHLSLAALLAVAAALVACTSSGPVRRVSEPAASIQQLTVDEQGNWSVDLRLQNYSSIAMRFDAIALELAVDGTAAGTLQATPALEVARESADRVSIALVPSAEARLLLANALASGRGTGYRLEGTLTAAPTDRGSARDYAVTRDGTLSPMPGLPGVLR